MTYNEFSTLPLDKLFEFHFYHGDVKHGVLVEDIATGKIYHIPPNRIKELNKKGVAQKDIGTEINLDSITYWNVSQPLSTLSRAISVTDPPRVKKMIILGAGASFDCSPDLKDDERPPLANCLFDDRFNSCLIQYQGAYNFSSQIQHITDLEQFFQNQWNKITSYHDPLTLSKIINVQYFLHDLFLQISKQANRLKRTNYNTLVNLAHEYTMRTGEHVLFVNFNYDLLLEEAMKRCLHYSYNSLDDYINHHDKKLLLLKPHGSCNFIRRLKPDIVKYLPPEYKINSVTILAYLLYKSKISYDEINRHLDNDFLMFDRDEIIGNTDTQELVLYLPQLLLPFKSKDEFVMPETHSTLLHSALSSIDEILVIGWKGTEAKFQSLLKSSLFDKDVKITAITNGDDSIKNEFSQSIPKASCRGDIKTFTEYMRHLMQADKGLFT